MVPQNLTQVRDGDQTRSLVANIFGVDGNANSLFDVGLNSILQNRSVQFKGHLLDLIKRDPAILRWENKLLNKAWSDNRFGREAFSTKAHMPLQLGGERGSLNPFSSESIKTWKVAFNPLTWVARSVLVEAQIEVSAEGCMNITYNLTDNLDLRPEKGGKVYFGGEEAPLAGLGEVYAPNFYSGGKRPMGYNIVSSILGIPYHDVIGGNDKMKTKATWTSEK